MGHAASAILPRKLARRHRRCVRRSARELAVRRSSRTAADELLVGEAIEFADRAKAASLDVSLHCVPAGQHLFLLGAGRVPETDAAIAEMGQWLRSKLAVSHQLTVRTSSGY
jgi:acetyl esterase/lipase